MTTHVGTSHRTILSDVMEEGQMSPSPPEASHEPESCHVPVGADKPDNVSTPGHKSTNVSAELKEIFDKLIDSRGNLDMRSVTSLIWLHRNDKDMVQSIAEKLIANSNERTVFNGIEFYLPQLAHMIIHLDVDLSSTALEQFSLVVCQVSLHVALQLNWILVAAMEDYQPELSNGVKNPKANPIYFTRCIKLLQNVERIVALGSPGDDSLLGGPQRERLKLLADQATHVITSPSRQFKHLQTKAPKGYLFHKRWVHRSGIHRRGWMRHWFCLIDRVLYCHSKIPIIDGGAFSSSNHLKRAIVLQDATIKHQPTSYKDGKYRYYFTVESPMGCWRLRADSLDEAEKWVHALQEAAGAPPVVLSMKQAEELEASANKIERNGSTLTIDDSIIDGNLSSTDCSAHVDFDSKSSISKILLDLPSPGLQKFAQFLHLDESQRKRYDFFNAEREFVRNLTDICEELRFIPNRDERGTILEERLKNVHIPPVAYLPLVKSTDLFRRVLRITPDEATPFSTKARCPTLVTFETCSQWLDENAVEEEEPLDVANFMHWKYISSEKPDPVCSTNALDGFQSVHPDELKPRGVSDIVNESRPPALSADRKSSFFNSLPKPHLPHIPAVSISRPNIGINIGANFTNASTTGVMTNADSAVGLHGTMENLPKPPRVKPLRPNVWRQPSISRQPSGLFSPFGGRSFKVRSIQVSRILMRWGNEPAMDTETEPQSIIHDEHIGGGPYNHSAPVSDEKDHLYNDEEDIVQGLAFFGSSGHSKQHNDNSSRSSSMAASNGPKCDDVQRSFNVSFNDGVSRAYHFLSYGESLKEKVARLKLSSEFGDVKGWRIERIICKSNDDLRQEVFVMQLISFYLEVFHKENLELWLQPYRILSTGKSTGLIQVLDNSISLHGLKKKPDYPGSLTAVFEDIYGSDSDGLYQARRRFAQSLAGYSVVSYLLAFKDRHNGNIMITADSRIIHIDFGFVFGQAPGNKFSMERAYFKLTGEYIDAMGGKDSDIYNYYVEMVGQGLIAAQKYASVALTLMEIMMFQSEFPCFVGGAAPSALRHFKRRLMVGLAEQDLHKRARQMVESSLDHPGTVLYDKFQHFSNGILH